MKNSSLEMHGHTVTWTRDQWIIQKIGASNPCAYHSRLEHALGWLINRHIGESGIEEVDELYKLLLAIPELVRATLEEASCNV